MALAVVAVVLAFTSMILGFVNQSEQEAFARRQEYANQSPQLARVVQLVARTMAEAAQSADDEKLRALLARSGFTIQVAPPPPAPAPPPPVAPTPVAPPPAVPPPVAPPVVPPSALSPVAPPATVAPVAAPRPALVMPPPARTP